MQGNLPVQFLGGGRPAMASGYPTQALHGARLSMHDARGEPSRPPWRRRDVGRRSATDGFSSPGVCVSPVLSQVVQTV